jgi:hypothetical protein
VDWSGPTAALLPRRPRFQHKESDSGVATGTAGEHSPNSFPTGRYRSRFSAFCLFIGYVDLAKRKKRSMTSPTIPTVQSFADFSRVMLAGQVSDDAGISVDFPLLRL